MDLEFVWRGIEAVEHPEFVALASMLDLCHKRAGGVVRNDSYRGCRNCLQFLTVIQIEGVVFTGFQTFRGDKVFGRVVTGDLCKELHLFGVGIDGLCGSV